MEMVAEKAQGQYRLLPIGDIVASPLNPRKVFEQSALDELAESIAAHGLQQPIVVRPRDPQPDRYDNSISPENIEARRYSILDMQRTNDGEHALTVAHIEGYEAAQEWCRLLNSAHYEIIMGERRYRACLQAGLVQIPAIVRNDVTTEDKHLELALIENLHRRDIDPIEAARGYKVLNGMGYSYNDVAKMVNLSQPSIANAVRLLELPDAVLRYVQAGQLGATHARALIKYAAFPEFLAAIVPKVIEMRLTTHDLEKELPYFVLDAANKAGAIHMFGYDEPFEVEEICKKCPFLAYAKIGYNSVCLNPAHYKQLAKEAKAALKEQNDALITAAKADPNKIPKIASMKWGTYREIFTGRPAPCGCTDACPCRSVAKDHAGAIVSICMDPARYDGFEAARRKAEEEEHREECEAITDEAMDLLSGFRSLDCSVELVGLLTDPFFAHVTKPDFVAAATRLGISAKKNGAGPPIEELIGEGDGPPHYRRRLSAINLLVLTVGTKFMQEGREAAAWHGGRCRQMEPFIRAAKERQSLVPPEIETFLAATSSPASKREFRDCVRCKGMMMKKAYRDDKGENRYRWECGCGAITPIAVAQDTGPALLAKPEALPA